MSMFIGVKLKFNTYSNKFRQVAIQKPTVRLLLGLLFSSSIGIVAHRRQSLSRSGVAGAILTGTSTVGFGGWPWGLSLIFFFISSSLFSHFRADQKKETAADKFSKGSQRDIAQVLANGGLASALALSYALSRSPRLRELLQAGYIGTLATATADTWATELGVLSPTPPRLITTGKRATAGSSGGVTPLGTTAALSGAFSLGLFFWLLRRPTASRSLLLIALISGFAGSLFDSWLGATYQAMYYCPTCQKETERHIHNCGTATRPLRGLSWLDNDAVNFLATAFGGVVAIALALGRAHVYDDER